MSEHIEWGGGYSNTASNYYSTVGGGCGNCASGYATAILGGYNNTASGYYSAVLGGCCNNTCNCNCTMIIGSNICANRNCATFVNNLSIVNLPSSAAGLPQGSLYYDSGTCAVKIVC